MKYPRPLGNPLQGQKEQSSRKESIISQLFTFFQFINLHSFSLYIYKTNVLIIGTRNPSMAVAIKRLDLEIEENKGVVSPCNNIQSKSREQQKIVFSVLLNGLGWHIWIDLGLKKGRRWFLNFLGAPSIINWNTHISCGKCDSELAYEVSWLFLSVPANHRPSILSNDKSGLTYCWCLNKRVGAPPANPPSQWETRAGGWWNFSNPAGQQDAKKATGPLNNSGLPEIICQDSLAGWWCTADLGWLNIASTSWGTACQTLNLYHLQTLRHLDVNTDQSGATLN